MTDQTPLIQNAIVDVATLFAVSPRFRRIAEAAGHTPGAEVNVEELRKAVAEHGYYMTEEDARAACVMGHNLRCNACGSWGADWTEQYERPGWGCLALCPEDMRALNDEHARHAAALQELRRVRFEQPIRTLTAPRRSRR
jgi:hypothetical protein